MRETLILLALDHVGFACRDLGQISPIFARLGFAATAPRELEALDADTGRVRPLGQTSAHIMFTDTYIELSAVPDATSGNHLEPFLKRYEGLHILALRDADLQDSHRRIDRDGYPVTEIQRAQREIRYGRLHGDARFRWFMLDHAATPEGLVCVVDNQTPRLVYQPEVLSHPNGAVAVSGLLVCADDADETLNRFGKICGTTDVMDDGDTQHAIELPNATLSVLSPAGIAARYQGFSPPASPSLAGLRIDVADIDVLIALLDAEYVAYSRLSESRISVQLPAPANGILIFRKSSGKTGSHADG